jgi:putative hydrolase of the HAD superfamily
LLAYICREINSPVKLFDINLAKMVRDDYISLSLTPRAYTVETLSEIKKLNYKTGLISVCGLETPELWPKTPIARFFDVVLFSSVIGMQKPDPRVFQMAYEQLKVKPESCLYIDDTVSNLTAAVEAGMSAVLFRNPENSEYPSIRPLVEKWDGPAITSLPEILDQLEE